MSELITQLGIDWKLLLAQVVNFLLLLWVLTRFVFGPLQIFLAKRSQHIQQGLENATKAQEEREELRVLRAQVTKKAQKEAEALLQEARARGQQEHEQLMKHAEEKVHTLANKARGELAREKEKMIEEAKKELAQVAMMAAGKLLQHTMDDAQDKEFVQRALREIK